MQSTSQILFCELVTPHYLRPGCSWKMMNAPLKKDEKSWTRYKQPGVLKPSKIFIKGWKIIFDERKSWDDPVSDLLCVVAELESLDRDVIESEKDPKRIGALPQSFDPLDMAS